MAKHFYFRGLGILCEGVIFTPEQQELVERMASAAKQSDAIYFDLMQSIHQQPWDLEILESIKDLFRSLDKAPALEAYYDREHQLHG